jgi:aspartate aminotransferase
MAQIKQENILANRTKNTSLSAIRQIFAQIPILDREREKNELPPTINLCIGQPHLPTNPVIAISQTQSFPDGSGYSATQGRDETLQAIVDLYNEYYPAAKYQKNEVMVTLGATGALHNAFASIINPEDSVILFTPYFSLYEKQVKNFGGSVIEIDTKKTHFKPNIRELEKVMQQEPEPKAIVLNYPNNPSGVVLNLEELTELARALRKYPFLVIIIDDVYKDLAYNKKILSLLDVAPDLRDRCITINSGAKALAGAPGMRIGMVGANEQLIQAMAQQQNFSITSVPDETQMALIASIRERLNPKTNWLETARETYKNNCDLVLRHLEDLHMTPTTSPGGGFFVMMNAKDLIGKKIPQAVSFTNSKGEHIIKNIHGIIKNTHFQSDADVVQYFLYVAGVATVPGSDFGLSANEGQIRISCAQCETKLDMAMQNIKGAVESVLKLNHSQKPVSLFFPTPNVYGDGGIQEEYKSSIQSKL